MVPSAAFRLAREHVVWICRPWGTVQVLVTCQALLEPWMVYNYLHWLPVKSRIVFKILLLTYKALNGHSPTYLTSLFNAYKLARSLRSSGQSLLQVPDVKTCTYGQRSFSFYATKLWNDLPFYIKQSESIAIFKKNLKTFLFCNRF